MKQFSVPMALVDFIPVILFIMAIAILDKDLKGKINKISFILFETGAGLVIAAGALKAIYKLIYALNLGNVEWLSNQFFSNQAFGFLLAGIGLVTGVVGHKGRSYAFLPTMALVGIMVVGLGAMDAGLCFLANKLKKRSALVCFIVSFFLSLGMGYLSSRDFTQASMNWIAQGINTVGQLLLYVGCRILHKGGLNKI